MIKDKKKYVNFTTGEEVLESDIFDYVLDYYDITMKGQDETGCYSDEQIGLLIAMTQWFFSGNWYLDNVEDTEEEYYGEDKF